jgi:hypothetical protein
MHFGPLSSSTVRERIGPEENHGLNFRNSHFAPISRLRALLNEIGYADALLVRQLPDGRLMLIDGHLRAETTPDSLVPVLVLDVNEEEADKLLLTLDPLAAMAEADAERISQLLKTVRTEDPAIEQLLRCTAGEGLWQILHPDEIQEAGVPFDRAGSLREKWSTRRGQLWQIGPHRLLCEDSREHRNLERLHSGEAFRLIVTDPPYGVNYAAKNAYLNRSDRGTRIQKPIENDQLAADAAQALFESSLKQALAFALPVVSAVRCVRVQQASAPNYSPPERIEATRPVSNPFEHSPVPMGRAITATGAQFAHFRGERLKPRTRWRSGWIRTLVYGPSPGRKPLDRLG